MGPFTNRLMLVLGLAMAGSVWASDPTVKVTGKVVDVTDGDTLRVDPLDGSKQLKIRMVGMDTPELHLIVSSGTHSQGYWAEQAHDYLLSRIPVGTIVDVLVLGEDKYGRSLGRVFLKGENLNLTLVQKGLAIPYMICGEPECDSEFMKKHLFAEFAKACEIAVKEGRGIFDPKKPLKEMPFEFRLRIQERKPDKFVGNVDTRLYFEPAQYDRVQLCDRLFFVKEDDAKTLGYKPKH